MRLFAALATLPCRATELVAVLMTNHATPARTRPLTESATSNAPQSLPPSYHVCCMRLSLLSMPPGRSVFGSEACPRMSCEHVADATQSPSGVLPGGWLLCGGCTYFSNPRI